jgi:carboxyvinyl-carboxyphosphonate phosphorylmutase
MESNRIGTLKKLLMKGDIVVAPGAYDALSAILIEKAGFPVVYITGAGIAAHRLGVPDIGLTTMSEVLDSARYIVNATKIPVICDVDNGYGNALNLIRAVKEFENIGIAAIQVEDQLSPKKCGHLEGKQIIPKGEMIKKIEACINVRRSNDFLIIARTDAIAVSGFEDAIDRGKAYVQAGADILFVEAPRSIDELKKISDLFSNVPLLANMVPKGGKTPSLSVPDLQKLGYRLVIFPGVPWAAEVMAMQRALRHLHEKGSVDELAKEMISFQDTFETVNLSYFKELEKKYLNL